MVITECPQEAEFEPKSSLINKATFGVLDVCVPLGGLTRVTIRKIITDRHDLNSSHLVVLVVLAYPIHFSNKPN